MKHPALIRFEQWPTTVAKLSVITTLALSSIGCQTVQDYSIPLENSFSERATLISINRPTWLLSDKAYHQQLGQFSITGADVSWQSSTKSNVWFKPSGLMTTQDVEDSFLKFILADLLFHHNRDVNYYKVTGEQDFAFTVHQANQVAVQTQCRLMFLNDERQEHYTSKGQEQVSTSTARKHSYLGCQLKQQGQIWHWVMDMPNGASARFSLQSSDKSKQLSVKAVTEGMHLINNQWVMAPSFINKLSGLTFTDTGMQASALSFDGEKPKVWLSQASSSQQQALLLAASYSALMYDWLDDKWREPSMDISSLPF